MEIVLRRRRLGCACDLVPHNCFAFAFASQSIYIQHKTADLNLGNCSSIRPELALLSSQRLAVCCYSFLFYVCFPSSFFLYIF